MKNIIAIAFLFLFVFSCQNDKLQSSGTMTWVCGEDEFRVEKEFDISQETQFVFNMKSLSLCPNSGIDLMIEDHRSVVFHDTISTFPSTIEVNVPASSNITVTTTVADLGNLILCERLGNVEIELIY